MNIFSFLAFSIFAAESVITPLPNDYQPLMIEASKPDMSFSELPLPSPSPSPQPKADPPLVETPTPLLVRQTKKHSVTIALLGDSMMNTLGSDAPYLVSFLHNTYPNTTIVIKNFGVGATTLDDAIARIPTIALYRPEIVVLESCAYNPVGSDQAYIDDHWKKLLLAVETIKATMPGTKIVIAATIAPNSLRFGDGAPGISFSPEEKLHQTTTIKKYIESTITFAKLRHIPLANAYAASLDSSGNGNLMYISTIDHIHYSDRGRALMSSKIVDAIVVNKLLE